MEKKLAVICAPGLGDALIMHIASHHLSKIYDVTTTTPHDFGPWFSPYQFAHTLGPCDAIFLQHDNSPRAKEIYSLNKPVYTFYGSHLTTKHGPLKNGFDYVCNPNQTMVDNVVIALKTLFHIHATPENGIHPPPGLIHRRYKKRVVIHTSSARKEKNWPEYKFQQLFNWLQSTGYEPAILPNFATISDLTKFIYESGFFIGNDSGPGHIASLLRIPHLIISPNEKQMRLWKPGWASGEIALPPSWIPNWKGMRLREKYWKSLISTNSVINTLKKNVLNN